MRFCCWKNTAQASWHSLDRTVLSWDPDHYTRLFSDRAGGGRWLALILFPPLFTMKMSHQHRPEEAVMEAVRPKVGPQHEIILHNDDVNTFDHVIESLVDVCDHEPIQAEQCAWIVHFNGKCSVKRGTFDQLEPRCTALLERGLSADIQ